MSESDETRRLPLPVPFRKEGQKGEEEAKKGLGPDQFWARLHTFLDMQGAAQAMNVMGMTGQQSKPVEMVKPWEAVSETAKAFGINLGELAKTREDEIKALRDAQTSSERELHELRVREIDHRVAELQVLADKLTEKMSQGTEERKDKSKTFLEELDELTGGIIKERIGGFLFPQAQGSSTDDFLDKLRFPDKVREALGVNPAQTSHDSYAHLATVRTDLARLLLEDERERFKIEKEAEVAKEKGQYLGTIASTFQEHAPDFFGALGDAAKIFSKRTPPEAPASQPPPVTKVECANPECGKTFDYPGIPSGEIECPHCHSTLQIPQE